MKSLLLSTSDIGGGAAVAGYRLHEGLRRIGRESKMLVREKLSEDDDVMLWPHPRRESDAWLDRLTHDLRLKARTPLSTTYFSLPWPGEDVASHALVKEAGVLNLHWVGHFIAPEGLRSLLTLGKPVIWTLHDQRAFTGGCHYSAGCEGFVRDCAHCPQLRPAFHAVAREAMALSHASLDGMPGPVIVAPSRWLASQAQRSALFNGCRVEVIPYGLDLGVFQASDRGAARRHFGLPEDALVILFGAQSLAEPRKGFDLVRRAIEGILAQENIAKMVRERRLIFAACGQSGDTLRATRLPLVLLGEQRTEEEMARALSTADLFICPSREDNLPNTVMEAMACGVPVLGTHVGGIPDMVADGKHGRLVPPDDADALARALMDLIERPEAWSHWGAHARTKCEEHYALDHQAKAYARLHDELLSAMNEGDGARSTSAISTVSAALGNACRQAALQLSEEETARAQAEAVARAREAPRDLKAELKRVEEALKQCRRNPLWFLFSKGRALKKQRDDLKIGVHHQRAGRLAAKQKPKPSSEAPQGAVPQSAAILACEGQAVHDAALIVTAAEINDRHGTGVLLARIFRNQPGFIHARSMNLYGGQTAGVMRICLPPEAVNRADLAGLLQGSTVRHLLSVPYDRSDVENTLALQEVTGAPLCVWLMDHNLGDGPHQIPQSLMQRLLHHAKLRLAISPEFCALYAGLFGHEVHFAPPVVEAALGQRTLLHLPPQSFLPATGVMLGNVWSQRWLKKLAATVSEAKVPLVAFGHTSPQWVKHDALEGHVNMRGFLPEAELVATLRSHPYAIVPTGTLDADDDLPDIARYSLPSRTVYLSAVGNLPIIVIGHGDSGVAQFVTRHELGVVVPCDGRQLRRAVQYICQPEQQLRFRRQAAKLAHSFACDDMAEWLWKSLDIGRPSGDRWRDFSGSRSASCPP